MSYVDQSRRPSPASMAAVIGVHAAIAAALVAGLTVSGALPEVISEFEATNIPKTPPPPPPPPPQTDEQVPVESKSTTVVTPVPPLDFTRSKPTIPTTDLVPPIVPVIPQPGRGIELDLPKPTPAPTFDAVGAKPRNDPGRWLSDRDYRPSWSRRDLTGLAKFRLEIAASGKVTNCAVTGSTGHSELDQATCKLVMQRAKFEPARGGNGEPVAGSYTGSVMWTLPD